MLYFIRQIKENRLVHGHDNFPVLSIAPGGCRNEDLHRKRRVCYDDEARAFVEQGINPLEFSGLTITQTSQESMAINTDTRRRSFSRRAHVRGGPHQAPPQARALERRNTILFVGFKRRARSPFPD
jgi:metallo-beta-lactamase family protein